MLLKHKPWKCNWSKSWSELTARRVCHLQFRADVNSTCKSLVMTVVFGMESMGPFMTAASHSFRGKLNKDHVSTNHLLSFKAKKLLLLSSHIAAFVSVKRNRRAVSLSCQPEGNFPHIPVYRCSITTGVRCSGNCSCGIMLNYNSQVQLPVLSTERAGVGCWEVWFSNIQGGHSYPISAFSCHITLVCF